MIHPPIQIFQQRAELLEIQHSTGGLHDTIAKLAAWMDLARERLSENDWVVLCEVGGLLYREGLKKRGTGLS